MQSGRNTAGLLLAVIFIVSNLTPAYAHQPINLIAANSSANKGPIIVDGKNDSDAVTAQLQKLFLSLA
ncbi:MAG: hypothetical protein O3A11_06330 [Actinomycetota bacterium]|nr:hypothetical protein [Actinomycetota bacterium]MDA2997112.1 hypothetical protein [Actinomycetota bacterium]